MYILVALLAVGFLCNLAVRPVPDELFTASPPAVAASPAVTSTTAVLVPASQWGLVAFAWTLVGVPIAWGVLKTLLLAGQLFR